MTRISVGRYRGPFQHGVREYAEIVELGDFVVYFERDDGKTSR